MAESVCLTAGHVALLEQVECFVAKEGAPFGKLWEERGCVPREALRMTELRWLELPLVLLCDRCVFSE